MPTATVKSSGWSISHRERLATRADAVRRRGRLCADRDPLRARDHRAARRDHPAVAAARSPRGRGWRAMRSRLRPCSRPTRSAALRRNVQVATLVDAEQRAVRSGATGRIVRFPGDVTVDTMLASRCADRPAGRSIDFFPSGMSCGGTIALARPGMGYEDSRQLADRRGRYCRPQAKAALTASAASP